MIKRLPLNKDGTILSIRKKNECDCILTICNSVTMQKQNKIFCNITLKITGFMRIRLGADNSKPVQHSN